jgi:serine/threonine protein kinase
VDHPHIIKYYESFIRKDKLFIIMEYAEKGDLKGLIKKHSAKEGDLVEENQVWIWFSQIVSAVKYLHNKKIIHRDIKLENIFVTSENIIKLGDFGISKKLENSMDLANSGVGTPFYLSPEICQGFSYSFKTDIWMLGCLLYEVCTLKKPFKSDSINFLINNIINSNPEPIDPTTSKYSQQLQNLIFSMLSKQPEDRPTIFDVSQKLIQYKIPLSKEVTINYNQFKTIDKNKLKIEIEEELSESSSIPKNENNIIPNESKDFSLNQHKKSTPSYGKNDINKILKNLNISPMTTPTDDKPNIDLNKKRTCNTTTNQSMNIDVKSSSHLNTNNSTPTSLPEKFQKIDKNFRSRHYKQISINISSIQSPDLRAVYKIENVEGLEFPSPISSISKGSNKPALTPQNLVTTHSNKISPKESLVKKGIPNTTKVGKNNISQEESPIRKALMKNFLIERYSKDKFDLMYNEAVKSEKIDEIKIKDIVGEDFKIAANYLRYLTSKK